ncbi:terminase small subunit [Loktanella fryxellensis]|nr:terminase small subunit [Loktanella fryxellensis]
MLTALGKRDIVVRLGHDAYDLEESARRYIASLRETASGRGGEEQVLNLTSERARLAREQADAQALKNAVLRGEYVPASEVERAWADTLRALRSRLLAVPSRLRQSMQHLTTSDVTMIDRELRDALQELGNADA